MVISIGSGSVEVVVEQPVAAFCVAGEHEAATVNDVEVCFFVAGYLQDKFVAGLEFEADAALGVGWIAAEFVTVAVFVIMVDIFEVVEGVFVGGVGAFGAEGADLVFDVRRDATTVPERHIDGTVFGFERERFGPVLLGVGVMDEGVGSGVFADEPAIAVTPETGVPHDVVAQ